VGLDKLSRKPKPKTSKFDEIVPQIIDLLASSAGVLLE